MAFPDDPLVLHVEMFLAGRWVEMTRWSDVIEDYYVDTYTDVYEGKLRWHVNRFFDQAVVLDHGRLDELPVVSPAEVSFRLENRDGWLTPYFEDSPWFPDVKRGCRVRMWTDDDTTFYIFQGEVSEIAPTWPDGGVTQNTGMEECWVDITCSGITRRLGQRSKPLRSALQRFITNPTNLPHVFDYWPMEDGVDADGASSGLPSTQYRVLGDLPLMGTINLQYATDDTLLGSEPLPTVGAGQDGTWATKVSTSTITGLSNQGWALDWHMRMPLAPAEDNTAIRFDVNTTGSYKKWTVTIGWDGTEPFIRIRGFDSSGAVAHDNLNLAPEWMFGDEWRHFQLAMIQSGSDVVYSLIWFPIPFDHPDHFDSLTDATPGTIGVPTFLKCDVVNAPGGGVGFGHVILQDEPLNSNWLHDADVGYLGESAYDRFTRLCAEEGLTGQYVLGPGGSGLDTAASTLPMGAQKALPLLQLLQEAADTDVGILCELVSSFGLRVRGRGSLYNQTPKMVLDASEPLTPLANPFAPIEDDQQVRNDVTAQRIDGGETRLFDQDHIDANDGAIYDEQFSVSTDEDANTRHYAGWRLHLGTWEGMRYPQITLDLRIAPELIPTWKTVRVGDRIQITNLPSQHPVAAVDLIVQGWSQTLYAYGWTVTINCSPAGPYEVAVWDESRWSPTDTDAGVLAI